jgi:endoglucanase
MVRVVRRISAAIIACASAAAPATAAAAELLDNFESDTSAVGTTYATLTDELSAISPTSGLEFVAGYASPRAGYFAYELAPGPERPFAGVTLHLSADLTSRDISAYAGVRFWAKGSGQYRVQVALTSTDDDYDHYGMAVSPSTEWQLVEVPFDGLTQDGGTREVWNPSVALELQWVAEGTAGDSGELFLDDVELYAFDEARAFVVTQRAPKLNHVGFLPWSQKGFTVASEARSSDSSFVVESAAGEVALEGRLEATAYDETAVTGEVVYVGDFSALRTPGEYVVRVGDHSSQPFVIAADVYGALFRDAARSFYLNRSGVQISDDETSIRHDAGHLSDAWLGSEPLEQRDLVGGWYNAGDYGKWTPDAAISASSLMWAYELRSDNTGNVDLGTPESTDGIPDILNQARWGLDWLFKMQNADGSVLHKVDSEPLFAWGVPASQDPHPRSAQAGSALDAAAFVAVMHQAERVFEPVDRAFATRCRAAANAAWSWLTRQSGAEATSSEARLWALAERLVATRDSELAGQLSALINEGALDAPSWQTPTLYGLFALAQSGGGAAEAAKAALLTLADQLDQLSAQNGYGVALAADDYSWGSLELVLRRANALLLSFELSAVERFRAAALRQLDYVLGRNSLGRSFVAGHGERAVLHPYHWSYITQGVALSGWPSGGPNAVPDTADPPLRAAQQRGLPPAQCYLDVASFSGSWGSNEGRITGAAALVLSAALLKSALAGNLVDEPTESNRAAASGCGCRVPGSAAVSSGASAAARLLAASAAAVALLRRRSHREQRARRSSQ